MTYQLTTKKKTWFRSPWVAIILIVFAGIIGLSVVRAFYKERAAAAMRSQYQEQLDEMTKRQDQLQGQIQDLSTPRGLDGEIRDRYRVAKPGEQLVVVVDNGSQNPPPPPETFWQKVRAFVGI